MNKSISDEPSATQTFEAGQIWRMEDSDVQIGLVGKTLVHFKHFKSSQPKRAPVSLANKAVLKEYLKTHKAVLVPERSRAKARQA